MSKYFRLYFWAIGTWIDGVRQARAGQRKTIPISSISDAGCRSFTGLFDPFSSGRCVAPVDNYFHHPFLFLTYPNQSHFLSSVYFIGIQDDYPNITGIDAQVVGNLTSQIVVRQKIIVFIYQRYGSFASETVSIHGQPFCWYSVSVAGSQSCMANVSLVLEAAPTDFLWSSLGIRGRSFQTAL